MTPLFALRSRIPWPVWIVFRAVRSALVASAFAAFWCGGCILAWTVLPLVALFARDRTRACQRLVAASFRLFHGYMRMLRLVEAATITLPPIEPGGRGSVLVANHTTLVDVTAILALPDVCCIAKAGYSSSRFVGRLLALAGFIPAGTTLAERARMIDDATRRLDEGFHVLVFPEGTRSPEGGLLPFRRGAFEIACRANVRIVPITLRCEPSALRRGQPFWRHPDTCARLSFQVGDALQPADFAHRSRPMRNAVEQQYRSRLGLLPEAGYNG